MIVHKCNTNTGQVRKLFEADFEGIKNGNARFRGEGGYVEHIGPYDNLYRLAFPDQDELRVFIEELIGLYNTREEQHVAPEGFPPDEVTDEG